MKITSLKALSCLFITIFMLSTSQFALADEKKVAETVVNEQLVYLNSSNLEQLLTLKGIGQKKAEAILAYRESVGTFKTVEELMKVKGIGKKIVLANKSRLKI